MRTRCVGCRDRLGKLPVRAGLSLIEVVACVTITAVLLVPIAAVVRNSGRTIRQLESDTTLPQSLRSTSNWLRDTLRSSSILQVSAKQVKLQLPSGRSATISSQGGDLVLDDGVNRSVIFANAQKVRFDELRSTDKPPRAVGLNVSITARDPGTGQLTSIETTVAYSL